jgi:hypothetical protein
VQWAELIGRSGLADPRSDPFGISPTNTFAAQLWLELLPQLPESRIQQLATFEVLDRRLDDLDQEGVARCLGAIEVHQQLVVRIEHHDERELRPRPVIASLSFGAERRFRLRHRTRADVETFDLTLGHGSLLVMKGDTQQHWKHSLPKTTRCLDERVNLTFRRVRSRSARARDQARDQE